MTAGYNGRMLAKGQFTLKSLFVATAFVAVAAALVQFTRATREPEKQFEAALLVPILNCGAIGVVRGRLMAWLSYGVAVDCLLMTVGLVFVWFQNIR
jgi:hypothetical protein